MKMATANDDQYSFFDEEPELPYQRHSDTSRDAAIAAEPNAGTQRAFVLALIRKSADGLTDEQIQLSLRMNPSTERPRRIELVNQGHVMDSGRMRLTQSGRNAVIWIAAA